jgi:hypothetical protein
VRESIPPKEYTHHVAFVSFIYMPFGCLEEERCDTLMEDDANIDSNVANYGNIIEYRDRVVGFSQTNGVDHDVTLASR